MITCRNKKPLLWQQYLYALIKEPDGGLEIRIPSRRFFENSEYVGCIKVAHL